MSQRNPKHGTPNEYFSHGCRCDDCRAAASRYQREYRAQLKDEGRKRTRRVPCAVCGKVVEKYYEARSRNSVCSERCRYFLRWGKFPPVKDVVHVGPRPDSWGHAPNVQVTVVTAPKWWGVITSGPCAWCGKAFTSTGWDARYCSKRCARARAKSNRGNRFLPSPVLRMAVYERDAWTCQLCGEPTDPNADPWSDWFPSLDHIVPQSHALIPDHSIENLRTAHRWCNAVRGDGTYHSDFFEEVTGHGCQAQDHPAGRHRGRHTPSSP